MTVADDIQNLRRTSLKEDVPDVQVSVSKSRIWQIGFSIVDQGLAVGGMFLANIALARTQSKEEYGIFALSYSVFTFLAGLHNAAILEAYTIYGSGRYRQRLPSYARLLWRSNGLLCFGLTICLTSVWAALTWLAPAVASRAVLGMALAGGILLTASFVRRTFYMRGRPDLAARFSTIFFVIFALLLWLSLRIRILNGFYAFLIAAAAWVVAALFITRDLPGAMGEQQRFLDFEPRYWSEHWKYSRWVFVTALVFQFLTQGYYWLAAGLLSVRDVGDLRAMLNIVTPLDQLFGAVTLLVLPMLSFRFASQKLAGLVPLWKKYCLGWFCITGSFAALVMFVGKPVMHVLYAGRFDDVAALVALLGLLPVIMGVGNTINAALKAMEKPNAVFYAYVTSGATTFLVGVPLMLHFGLRGAIYGMLASSAVYTGSLGIAFLFCLHSSRRRVAGAARAHQNSPSQLGIPYSDGPA